MERPKENGGVMGWGPEKGEWFGAHGPPPPGAVWGGGPATGQWLGPPGGPPPHQRLGELSEERPMRPRGPGSREEAAPWPRTADC